MNNSNKKTLEQRFRLSIILVSILIPTAVAILFTVKLKDFGIEVEPLSFLPPIYASINGLTALLLLMGVMAIKNGNKKVHERFMTTAIACSVVFFSNVCGLSHDSRFYGLWRY
jgi:putative membrane protein